MWFGENNIKYITLVLNNGKAMRFAVIFFKRGNQPEKRNVNKSFTNKRLDKERD